MEEIVMNDVIEKNTELEESCDSLGYIKSEPVQLVGNSQYVEIKGTPEQVQEMFDAWSAYCGEVENPLKTAANYNKGNYAPLDEVLSTVKPVLAKHGFGFFQVPKTTEKGVSVSTVITYRNGAYMAFPELEIPVMKPDAQTIIAGTTYARRGSLNAILAIYGENDDDGNAASKGGKKKNPSKPDDGVDAELSAARTSVRQFCTQKVKDGGDKEAMYAIIKKYTGGSNNPMYLKSVEDCEKVKAEINVL